MYSKVTVDIMTKCKELSCKNLKGYVLQQQSNVTPVMLLTVIW